MKWTHGPSFEDGGIRFRLWAPGAQQVELVIEGRDDRIAMTPAPSGFFETFVKGLRSGARYRFALSGGQRVPDPASRFQPEDVNGPSEAIDPAAYRWRESWPGREWDEIVLYELHVGAFSPEGTFAGAALKLDHLAELGVTAVEIMPVSDFSGRWNWGYDGAFPYAPDATYGRPEDFKAFVERAHEHGIAVLLDVVYNHFGPEGNFLSLYAPDFFTSRHRTSWGDAIQFDGPTSRPVRDFFIRERSILDRGISSRRTAPGRGPRHQGRCEALLPRRARHAACAHAIRGPSISCWKTKSNDPSRLTRARREAPISTLRSGTTTFTTFCMSRRPHETSGYYAAYGRTELLGRALAEGFAYQGEMMPYRNAPRGGPSAGLPPTAFVSFIQNHDQIGNRAFGERLNSLAPAETIRALASVYLLAPQIPMLFMGEEWGETRPVPFLLRLQGKACRRSPQGTARGILAFPRVRRSKTRGEDTRPFGRSDLPRVKARLEPHRRGASRLLSRVARRAP